MKGYDAVLADVVALIDAGRHAVVRTSNSIEKTIHAMETRRAATPKAVETKVRRRKR